MKTHPSALRSLSVPSDDTKPLSWSDYRHALRRRWWLIAVITLAVAAITLAISIAQTPIYQAESRIQVSPDGTASVFQEVGAGVTDDSQRAVSTEAEIIESERVRARVMTDLGIDVVPPSADAVVIDRTNIIAVRVLSADPGTAEILANQYVTAYVELRREAAVDQLVTASEEVQAKINDVQGQIDGLLPEDPQVDSLVSQLGAFRQALNQLQIDTSLKTSGVAVVQQAATPTEPVAPRPLRDTLIAALIALVASVILVLVLERINKAVRSDRDLARISDVPVLADVPNAPPTDNRPISLSEPSIGAAEAYRGLRSTFLHLAASDDARMIVVTSSVSDEGKTTTAANLAIVLAQAGRRVVLVDADLRQPHQHDMFGATVEPGLVDLLTWQHDELAFRRLDLGDGAELMLIPAGSVPLGSSELLGSDRGRELFAELRSTFDYVIIDSAPILPVADTMSLGALADATVLVVRSTTTSRTTVQTALRRLARIDVDIVGFILNRVPSRFMPGGIDRYGLYGLSDMGIAPPMLVEGPDADQFNTETITEVYVETDQYGDDATFRAAEYAATVSGSSEAFARSEIDEVEGSDAFGAAPFDQSDDFEQFDDESTSSFARTEVDTGYQVDDADETYTGFARTEVESTSAAGGGLTVDQFDDDDAFDDFDDDDRDDDDDDDGDGDAVVEVVDQVDAGQVTDPELAASIGYLAAEPDTADIYVETSSALDDDPGEPITTEHPIVDFGTSEYTTTEYGVVGDAEPTPYVTPEVEALDDDDDDVYIDDGFDDDDDEFDDEPADITGETPRRLYTSAEALVFTDDDVEQLALGDFGDDTEPLDRPELPPDERD